jgi:hypothetical protein
MRRAAGCQRSSDYDRLDMTVAMAGVTEKVLPHLEGMEPDEILSRVDQIEKLDKVARRTFGFDNNKGQFVGLRLNILNMEGNMFGSEEEAKACRNAHRSPQDAPQPQRRG